MSTETVLVERMGKYFERKGWIVRRDVKIRGRIADIVAVKGNKITTVEVKGSRGDIERGIMQSLHQKGAVNFSYLAIHKDMFAKSVKETCQNLGIGLILVNEDIEEIVKPEHTSSLESVKKKIFKEKPVIKKKAIETKSLLGSIFHAKSQILILKLFFLNPTKEFHLSDIARRTDLTSPAVSKEMTNLTRVNLVTRRDQGNLSFYRINTKSIIFDEMKRIFLKYEIFSELLSKELAREATKYALIYGSFAKGTEKEGSDIDLLVIGDAKEEYLLKTIPKIERNTGREINFILWTEKEFFEKIKKNIPLIKEIFKTPVIMIVGDEDEFKRLAKE